MYIDSHCHLDFPEFDQDLAQILARCRSRKISKIVVPGVVASHWGRVISLCEAYPDTLFPALGLHPCFSDRHQFDDLALLRRQLTQHRVVALGEIGLDFWLQDADRNRQTELLTSQLEMAKEFALPVLLHVRKAHDQVLSLLRRFRLPQAGIVHAFSGSDQQASQYLSLGFKLGVGGALTYSRAARLRRQVVELPLESWVLETDAPDMPLYGRQGRVNRPDYLPEVGSVFAALREEPLDAVAAQIRLNTQAILPLLDRGGV